MPHRELFREVIRMYANFATDKRNEKAMNHVLKEMWTACTASAADTIALPLRQIFELTRPLVRDLGDFDMLCDLAPKILQ